MGRHHYVPLRRCHNIPIRRCEDVPLRHLSDVPLRHPWLFHLRRICDVAGTCRETSLRHRQEVLLMGGMRLQIYEHDLARFLALFILA